MSLLGDFLESFYGSGPDFETVRAKLRRVRKHVPTGPTSRDGPGGNEGNSSPTFSTIIVESEIWATLPDRVRMDAKRTQNGKSDSTFEIIRGDERLKRNSAGVIEIGKSTLRGLQHAADAAPTDYRRHFDRGLIRQFFSLLILEDGGACQVAGRSCVRIHAVPLRNKGIWPHWLPWEADAYEFAADLCIPSLLSITGIQAGKAIEYIDVVQVAFNDKIANSIFDCQPLPDEENRSVGPVRPVISHRDRGEGADVDAFDGELPF